VPYVQEMVSRSRGVCNFSPCDYAVGGNREYHVISGPIVPWYPLENACLQDHVILQRCFLGCMLSTSTGSRQVLGHSHRNIFEHSLPSIEH
jgi:hypothetical protein